MSAKYNSISPCDKSICEFFNQVDEIAKNAGMETRIAENSGDSLLEILRNGESIGTIDGMSASMNYQPYPEIFSVMDDITQARMRIPFASHPEAEALRLAELERLDQPGMEMTL